MTTPHITDYATIQDALDHGGCMFIPRGDYAFSETLILPDGLHLYGEGLASRLIFTGSGTAMRTAAGVENRLHLAAFQLYSEGVESTIGIHLDHNYFVTLERVKVCGNYRGFVDAGILIGNAAAATASRCCSLRDCHVQECAGHAIRLGNDSGADLSGGHYQANGGYGVYAPSDDSLPNYLHAVQSVIEGNSAGQVFGKSLYSSSLIQCHIENGQFNTNPPIQLGDGSGACKAVSIVNCGLNGTLAPYCILTNPSGIIEGLSVIGCRLSLKHDTGTAVAHIGLSRVSGAHIMNNALHHSEVPLIQEIGIYNSSIMVQDISPVVTTAISYTARLGEDVIIASGAGTVITLPENASVNTQFTIKRNDAVNAILVQCTGSDTIGNKASLTLHSKLECVTVVSDGGNWHIIGTNLR